MLTRRSVWMLTVCVNVAWDIHHLIGVVGVKPCSQLDANGSREPHGMEWSTCHGSNWNIENCVADHTTIHIHAKINA